MTDFEKAIIGALQLRLKNGRHMHHSQCIHNMPPEDQIAMRGESVEWWMAYVGSMPVQITPDDWEIAPPNLLGSSQESDAQQEDNR